MMTDSNAHPIEVLEIRLAHQERMIEELNSVVTRQAEDMARMTRRLEALVERFVVMEEKSQPAIPIDRPPHW